MRTSFLVSTETFKNRDGEKAPLDFSLDLLADVNLSLQETVETVKTTHKRNIRAVK